MSYPNTMYGCILQGAVDDRKHRLDDSEIAQQYLFDAAEAEAFMGEQELFLMSDDRAKVCTGAVVIFNTAWLRLTQ